VVAVVDRCGRAAEIVDPVGERGRLPTQSFARSTRPVGAERRRVDRGAERDPRLIRADVRGRTLLPDVLFTRLERERERAVARGVSPAPTSRPGTCRRNSSLQAKIPSPIP